MAYLAATLGGMSRVRSGRWELSFRRLGGTLVADYEEGVGGRGVALARSYDIHRDTARRYVAEGEMSVAGGR